MEMPNLDFLAKEWPVIRDAPHLFFGMVIAIIIPSIFLMWGIFNWAYKLRLATKDAQLEEREERVTRAKEHQQYTEQKNKDLKFELEKLDAQLKAKANIEDIAVTVSSAKTKAAQLGAAAAGIFGMLNATQPPDTANFRGTVE